MNIFAKAIQRKLKKVMSWYFRNALVRANYNDLQNGIHATTKFFEMFFENLLMNAGHELKNRYIHVDFDKQSANQIADSNDSKCKICTLEELAIIQELKSPFCKFSRLR